jgi:cytochrome c-type biogenesis protein CcmH
MPPNRVAEYAALFRPTLLTLLVSLTLVISIAPAHAARPDEMLANPALEARAEQVGHELRCLVCRNQSVEDSEADLAHDMRVLIRRRISAGDSNAEVIAYLRSRYGDFVLLKPPFEIATALLWGGPLAILLLGGIVVARFYRRRRREVAAPLSEAEQQQLAAVLSRENP